jgi:O-antigen ligase
MLPLSQLLSSRLLLLAFIVSVFMGNLNSTLPLVIRGSWDSFFYFSALMVGLIYSSDFSLGVKTIETNLSFVAVPFIFYRIRNLNKSFIEIVIKYFAIGLSLACIICIITAIFKFSSNGNPHSFFFYDLLSVIDFQPTYFAYFLIFIISYNLFKYYYDLNSTHSTLTLLNTIFLFIILLLTGGQTAFTSMLLIFSFFVLKFLVEEKTRKKKIVVVSTSWMVLGMFLSTLIGKDERNIVQTDSWDRLILWESAIEATPNWIVGVGTGDYKSALNTYYRHNNLEKFAEGSYNSHNQFIQIFFSNGLLGISALLLLLGRPLYLSVKNRNIIGVLLVFPFLIYGITEVFLGRYQGIVFFVMVQQICILQSQTIKQQVGANNSFDFIAKRTK